MSELYLIDGNSYIYRAYYAIRGLSTSKGLPTNAIYGFTNMLMKILNEKGPEFLAIAFDPKGPTKRHEVYEAYKAQRPKMPDALSVQIPYIHRMVDAFHIPLLMMEGYEADDVIGTAARKGEQDGYEVIIVTGDKDMLQLVTPHVRVYDPMKDKLYGESDVLERFGVSPAQVVEMMALMGDSIDNIPGVTGIGEKTARELIATFGTVENLLAHLEEVKRPKLRSLLQEQTGNARLSRELAQIHTGLPIRIVYDSLRLSKPDSVKMTGLLRELEFSGLLRLFTPPQTGESNGLYRVLSPETETVNLLERVQEIRRCALHVEADSPDFMAAEVAGIGISFKDKEAWCVPAADQAYLRQWLRQLTPLIESAEIRKYSHDIKRQMILLKRSGLRPEGYGFDTMIASYLLNPGRADHSMESIALEYLQEMTGAGAGGESASVSEASNSLACQRADFIWRLAGILEERLVETGVRDLFYDIEIPLAGVLADMEMAGIRVDPDILWMLSGEMDRDMTTICRRIYAISGEEFNINSPKQLAGILFEKLGLKPIRKTKTGYSTDEAVLTALALQHELPAEILNYRQIAKLKSTYVDALLGLIHPATGRVHTSFSQAVTATGRLSSSKPNLQNIPIRTDMGQRIREAFTTEEGCLFLSSDYSQIELRILAHMSGDELLTSAFQQGEDIHTRTAAEIFGLSPAEVTPEMRRRAKAVNFGIVYGMSPFGLASDIGISQQEAKEYIDNYFARHKGVREFIEKTLAQAKEDGYVTTLLQRRRYLPELASGDNGIRQFGERIAINTPIQGSAADIIKLAMIRIHRRLQTEGLRGRMILQVHDELLFEVPAEELETTRDLVIAEMEGVIPLSVPLKVDTGTGKTWREAG